ncbi:MAG: hypothetical protein HRU03_01275, partial [Nanoarchaeales archaeon]|nr:hypothetical protein [Nanoarchaeales archaeon]
MIQLWLLFSFLSLFFKGLNSFFQKLSTEKKFNKNRVVILDTSFFFLFSIIFFISFDLSFPTNFTVVHLMFVLVMSLLIVSSKKFTLLALENVSSSIFFTYLSILTPLIIILISYLVLGEVISLYQLFGFIFGIFVFLLLYEKKDIPNKKSKFLLGIFLTFLVVFAASLVNPIHKVLLIDFNLSYILIVGFVNWIFSLFFYFKGANFSKNYFINSNEEIFYSFLLSLCIFLTFIFLFKAYILASVSV